MEQERFLGQTVGKETLKLEINITAKTSYIAGYYQFLPSAIIALWSREDFWEKLLGKKPQSLRQMKQW